MSFKNAYYWWGIDILLLNLPNKVGHQASSTNHRKSGFNKLTKTDRKTFPQVEKSIWCVIKSICKYFAKKKYFATFQILFSWRVFKILFQIRILYFKYVFVFEIQNTGLVCSVVHNENWPLGFWMYLHITLLGVTSTPPHEGSVEATRAKKMDKKRGLDIWCIKYKTLLWLTSSLRKCNTYNPYSL